MKRKRYQRTKNYHFINVCFILSSIFLLSIGFSAFQNQLSIDGANATVRIDKDIRIMGSHIDQVNDAASSYLEYNVSNITSGIQLNSGDSYVIFLVDVYNLGNTLMGIRSININDENLKVEVLNYELKSKLCDDNQQCSLGVKKQLQIKVSYQDGDYDASNTSYDIRLDFLFGRIYSINYYDIDSVNLPSEIIEGEELNINIPNRIDYFLKVFMNNQRLSDEKDYHYKNDNLILPNINGDIRIYFKLPICQRATVLHTEECQGNYCSVIGYSPDGSMGTTTITYGSLGTNGILSSGDAFDCDVNGDGVYDSSTERFYYVTDTENDVAIFIYYNNVSGGEANRSKFYAYDSSSENWHGPRSAIQELPTTKRWSNVSLIHTERILKNETNTNSTKDGHTFPNAFSYSNYAARLLTMQELRKAIHNTSIPTWNNGELNDYLYLVENTNFSSNATSNFDGYWLETPRYSLSTYAWFVYGTARRVHSAVVSNGNNLGVRPVIEVLKSDIFY